MKTLLALLAGSVLVVAAWDMGHAHEAPKGWSYPFQCCSGYDCREVPADWIVEGPGDVRIVPTGERIPYSDSRIRESPDGEFHWCSVAGKDDSRTICLFVPPKSF